MLSLLYLRTKAQKYFVNLSYMFLDNKILLKIWLNLGLKLNPLLRNQAVSGKSPVTIPETTAGHNSVPVPFSFLSGELTCTLPLLK